MTQRKPELFRLSYEWLNNAQPDYLDEHGRLISMTDIKKRLLRRKATLTYNENFYELCSKSMARHAHDPEYIAAILYLLDERDLAVNELQPVIHLQLGHAYRQLGRAGVQWVAASRGFGPRLRENYVPWRGEVYIDPLSGLMLVGGERRVIPRDLEIFKSYDEDAQDAEERVEVMGVIEGVRHEPPLPVFPFRDSPVKYPPSFPKRKAS